MQARATKLEADLERYDETSARLCSDIVSLRSLIVQLPAMAQLQRDEMDRLIAWKQKYEELSNLSATHAHEVAQLAESVDRQRGIAAQLRCDAQDAEVAIEIAQTCLEARQTHKAKNAQVSAAFSLLSVLY